MFSTPWLVGQLPITHQHLGITVQFYIYIFSHLSLSSPANNNVKSYQLVTMIIDNNVFVLYDSVCLGTQHDKLYLVHLNGRLVLSCTCKLVLWNFCSTLQFVKKPFSLFLFSGGCSKLLRSFLTANNTNIYRCIYNIIP